MTEKIRPKFKKGDKVTCPWFVGYAEVLNPIFSVMFSSEGDVESILVQVLWSKYDSILTYFEENLTLEKD